MRYFDTFCFFNELELLKLRCEELKPLNPIHVLVEATMTHTGYEKELVFEKNKHLFSEYNIRHIIVDNLPNNGNAWDAENAQRDAIMKGLDDLGNNDVVVISDLDEIPRWQAVQFYESRMNTASIQMDQYSCYLNLLQGTQSWGIAKITTGELLKKSTPNKIRNGGSTFSIYFGGWHFAWLGGIERMMEKLDAYAHIETNTAKFRDSIKYKYESGQSLWGQDFWAFVNIDKSFPSYLQAHQKEFVHLIKLL